MRAQTPLIAVLALACGQGTVEEVVSADCPTLSLSAASLEFTEARLGEARSQDLVLRHACSAGPELSVDLLLAAGAGFTVEPSSLTLAPGEEATVSVSYTADGYADAASEVFVLSSDPVQPQSTVALTASTDPDQDGDGAEARAAGGEDCDDQDPLAGPGGVETWNGIDDDCDGRTDVLSVDQVDGGYLIGGTYRSLAYQGNLGRADFDGDGNDELIVASSSGYGYGYVLDAAAFSGLDDEAGRYADASWGGAAAYNALGIIGPRAADHTGDGRVDLVVGGSDYYYKDRGNHAVVVFDGATLGLELGPDNAVTTLTGEVYYTGRLTSHSDLDGDGVAEIIYGTYGAITQLEGDRRGALLIHEGGSGELALVEDRAAVITGQADYDYLGRTHMVGDLDGDGYDDLVTGAYGEDSGDYAAGMIYVVPGGSALPDGNVDAVASARIQGETYAGYLGGQGEPILADVDGDDIADLVFASIHEDTVYVFSDASTVEGELDASDADYLIEGSSGPDFFGLGLTVGDFDGDADPELAIGAPDTTVSRQGAVGDRGEVSLFDLTGGSPERIGLIRGMGRQDTFGQTLAAWDLDGDGTDELLTDAPGFEDGGRLYLLTWTERGP